VLGCRGQPRRTASGLSARPVRSSRRIDRRPRSAARPVRACAMVHRAKLGATVGSRTSPRGAASRRRR
jgi:hypothetical protein